MLAAQLALELILLHLDDERLRRLRFGPRLPHIVKNLRDAFNLSLDSAKAVEQGLVLLCWAMCQTAKSTWFASAFSLAPML